MRLVASGKGSSARWLANDNVPNDDKIMGNRGMGAQGIMQCPMSITVGFKSCRISIRPSSRRNSRIRSGRFMAETRMASEAE